MIWLDLLFIILAAAGKAVADTLTHHFSTSIFKKLRPSFWNPDQSWRTAKFLPFTKYKVDAWHLANSLMITSFCGAIAAHPEIGMHWPVQLLLAGFLFIAVFNTLYNHVLRD